MVVDVSYLGRKGIKMKTAIGIDLGGTSVKYALISEEGNFLYQGKLPSEADVSAEAVISQLLKAIDELQAFAAQKSYAIAGIGIGTPGIVDGTDRIVIGGAENIVGWENLRLADRIEQATGLETRLANDANVMGLAEARHGAAKGASHVVFLTVGTGIGGAVIIDGKLFNGFANRGTELGHVPLIANGEPCACGSVGCLETYASTSALVKRFATRCQEEGTLPDEEIDGKFIMQRYAEKDKLAVDCLDEHCFYLGRGIAGFINIFSPQKVIIGGGLSEAGEFYIDKVRKEAFRHAMPDTRVNTEIIAARLGNGAGCIGAASLILNS